MLLSCLLPPILHLILAIIYYILSLHPIFLSCLLPSILHRILIVDS
jgi:hypothetical protein